MFFQRSCLGYVQSEVEFDMDHIFSMTPISKMYRMVPIELAKVKKQLEQLKNLNFYGEFQSRGLLSKSIMATMNIL